MKAGHVAVGSAILMLVGLVGWRATMSRPAPKAESGTSSAVASDPSDQAATPHHEDVPEDSEVEPGRERKALALAARPIEEQSKETQDRYLQAWVEGLERTIETQETTLGRLKAERVKSTPELRAVIDERIAAKQSLLKEREAMLRQMQKNAAKKP